LWFLYFDPGYGRADLRAAASAIQARRAPDDVVLHLGPFTATPFEYYHVPDNVILETNDRAELCNALARHPRGWLLTEYASDDEDARAAAEDGITRGDYASGLVQLPPERFLGVSVFQLRGC